MTLMTHRNLWTAGSACLLALSSAAAVTFATAQGPMLPPAPRDQQDRHRLLGPEDLDRPAGLEMLGHSSQGQQPRRLRSSLEAGARHPPLPTTVRARTVPKKQSSIRQALSQAPAVAAGGVNDSSTDVCFDAPAGLSLDGLHWWLPGPDSNERPTG